ncbi:esterase/lipase family protein [Bacillus sp. SCS-153A]|uniref:esterase/lipase family protein n=1 Tax=Rossellomorea sedimentorum TaxID=3115294 RepID=UPI003906B8B7
MKRLGLMVLLLFLILPVSTQAGTIGGKNDPGGVPGQWYAGDTPGYVDGTKPVLVFVHGINSSSKTWWENNNMYQTAFNNGYETAFIDVHPDRDMWENGAVLNNRIRDIYNYFGQKKLVIIAHSKGGIDAQNALVQYGAYPYVSNLITLSTPHHGSQLADLAYSSWAGWLAGILGSKNDATYSLQTGYMKNYRSQVDSHINRSKNPVYTLAGTSWGSFGSSLYWGGLYLRAYGSNDGAVTVANSRLPYGKEVRVDKWNHTTVREGRTFSYFQPYLTTSAQPLSMSSLQEEFTVAETIENKSAAVTTAHRGGVFENEVQETFQVEENVAKLDLDWLSDKKTIDLQVVSPSGDIYNNFHHSVDDGIFKGGHHHSFQIPNPETGQWTIKVKKNKAAYLVTAGFHSDLNDEIILDESTMELKNKGNKVKDLQVTIKVNKDGKKKKQSLLKMTTKGKVPFTYKEEGIYSLTLDVTGKTIAGNNFERTIVKSFYVDKNGKLH